MALWALDTDIVHLNHGSFGACPRSVLDAQQRWREKIERNPTRFMMETRQPALDAARDELARFLGADPAGVVFVDNATTGVNAVLRSLEPDLGPGDELLITDHAYNACRAAVEVTAMRTGSTLVTAEIPFPIDAADRAAEAVLDHVTARTRLVLLDHVTSSTALVLPVAKLIRQLEPEVPVLVDGAHAAGMVPLSLDNLGAAFAVGNCHKWMCAPKGAGYLHVREDHRERMLPLTVSHGWNSAYPPSASRFHGLFDWSGTNDPTPWLTVPDAIRAIEAMAPGGWPEVMTANRDLALEARGILCDGLGLDPPAPDDMIGSMAAVPLPDTATELPTGAIDPLVGRMRDTWRIEVPIVEWPASPHRVVRVSAQRYNHADQYRRLAKALVTELRDAS